MSGKAITRIAGIVVACGVGALAQQPTATQQPTSAEEWNAAAIKAYHAKDYKAFLADERKALALEPENPRVIYNAACGEALTGSAKAAVGLLEQLLARKLDLGAEADGDFAEIRNTPEWAETAMREIFGRDV